ncbi:glycosyltransferase [Arthrobacter pigmenti]
MLSNPASRAAELPAYSDRVPNRGVMICRLEQAKNVFAAIEVIDLVKQAIPAIRLDIYGSGLQRHQLQERIDQLQLQENVILHGHVPNAGEQFRSAVFSLLTSRKEGQPLVLLESQGRGCPPVSFKIRYGPDDVISDGENGFLVSEGDIQAAADRIIRLCSNDGLAQTMSKEAWRSSERYGYPEVLKRFGSIVGHAWKQRPERLTMSRMSFRSEGLSMSSDDDARLVGSFTWKQTSGPPAQDELALSLQLVPHDAGQPLWFPGKVLSASRGKLDVRFDVPHHYLDRQTTPTVTHNAFVIANGKNILFRQRLDLAP